MLLSKTLVSFLCLWLVHGRDIQSGPPYSNSTSLPGASSQSPAPASISKPPITSSDPPPQSTSDSLPVSTDVATSDTSVASSTPPTTDPATQTTSDARPESSIVSTSAASTSDGGGAGSGGAAAVGGVLPGGLPGSPLVGGGSGGGGGDGDNKENNDQQSNTSQESQSSTESSTQSSSSEASSTTSGCAFPSDLPPDQDETVQFPSPTWDLDAPDFPTPVWSVILNDVDLPPVTAASQDPVTTTDQPSSQPPSTVETSQPTKTAASSMGSVTSQTSVPQAAMSTVTSQPLQSSAAAYSTQAQNVECSITRDFVGHISQLTITYMAAFAGSQGEKLQDALRSCGHVYAWEINSDKGRVDFSIASQDVDASCVEGGIKTAGGPSVTCEVGSNPAVARRWYQPHCGNESVPVNFTVPGRYDRRVGRWEAARSTATMADLPSYNGIELLKRRGMFSDPDPTKVEDSIWSAATIPGVDECKDHIRAKGLVGTRNSIFYTSYPRGKDGYDFSKQWARKNKCQVGDIVYWDIMVSPGTWQGDVERAIAEPYALLNQQTGSLSKQFLFNGGRKYTEDFLNQNSLRFLENLSQAYAELTKGEAWLFMPDFVPGPWSDSSGWGAFEYPALTRNPDVTKIWRVNVGGSFFDPTGEPTLIWDSSRGDGPSPFEPKGTRERTNPPDSPLKEVSPAPPVNP